ESTSEEATILFFCVSDTGIGIPEGKQKAIFEAFVQADASTTRRYGGSGLGLAISNQLVQLMGGRISVESKLRKGSAFSFSLPFELARDSSGMSRREPTSSQALLPLDVLVVEDNAVNQKLVGVLLKRMGHEATVVASGQAALRALKKRAFDL